MDELTLACTLGLECRPSFALSLFWGKVRKKKKRLHQAHLELHDHELEHAKKRMNHVLDEKS